MLVVIRVPHQFKPELYVFKNKEEICSSLFSMFYDEVEYAYHVLSKEELDDLVDDKSQISHLDDIKEKIVEVQINDEINYYPLSKAPDEFDIAIKALGDDMHKVLVYSPEEAIELKDSYFGHQWVEIQQLLNQFHKDLKNDYYYDKR